MNIITLDVESTIFKYPGEINPKKKVGHPLASFNRCVLIGIKAHSTKPVCYQPLYIDEIQNDLDTSLVVGFNIKFDLHWMRRLGFNVSNWRIWDCQIAEYMLSSQQNKYPSLNATAESYGLGSKLDVISEEYWEKGIDTDEIPINILEDYLKQDLELTYQVYLKQLERLCHTT